MSKAESRKLRAAEVAAHNEGELANAHQMAQITGRRMSNWLPGKLATNPLICSDDRCGWSGMETEAIIEDGCIFCPRCGSSDLW